MKKKLFLFILAALTMLTLVACTGASSNTNDDGNEQIFQFSYDCIIGINRDVCTDADITLPSVSDEGQAITEIGGSAFAGDTLLTSIVIPEGVTSIGYQSFKDCTSLKSVTLPSTLVAINEKAFEGCTSLETINFPESLEIIEKQAFSRCNALTAIHIPQKTTAIGENALSTGPAMTSITVAEGNKYYRSENNCLIDLRWGSIILGCGTSVIPTDGSITFISNYAFSQTSISSVTIPDSVDSIGSGAFSGCTSLTNITLSNELTQIGYAAFYGCTQLESITLPKSLESLGSMAFAECANLKDVYFNDVQSHWRYIENWGGGNPFDTTVCTIHCTDGSFSSDSER